MTEEGPARPAGAARTAPASTERAAARLTDATLAVHDAWRAARAAGAATTPTLDAALDRVLRVARAQGIPPDPALAFVRSLGPRPRVGGCHVP